MLDERHQSFKAMLDEIHKRHVFDTEEVCEVWLVRHADAYDGLAELQEGVIDPPISTAGQWQAARLADRLAGLPIDQIWSSDLLRSRQTAELLAAAHGLEVQTDLRLREVRTHWDEGPSEPRLRRDIYPFPEPEAEVVARMQNAILDIIAGLAPASGRRRVVAVSHSAAIIMYAGHLLGLGWGRLRVLPYFTSVSVVAVQGDQVVVQSLGDITHLAGGRE
jgi:probable phosphoglycerate mutase